MLTGKPSREEVRTSFSTSFHRHTLKKICVDLLGPYMMKAKDCMILDLMCLTMINQAISWVKIVELPTTEVQVIRKGEELVEMITSRQFSTCFMSI